MADATSLPETWLPAPGYETTHEVSNAGRVRSLDRTIHPRRGAPYKRRGRILKTNTQPPEGRHSVALCSRRPVSVAELVLTAFVGPRPPGLVTCHNNGDCSDDHLTNLRWDTQSENMLDRVRHGTDPNASKTRCRLGHLLLLPNLRPAAMKRGWRTCLACARAHNNVNDAARKGIVRDLQEFADRHYAAIMAADNQECA